MQGLKFVALAIALSIVTFTHRAGGVLADTPLFSADQTITVTTLADSGPGSLRRALKQAGKRRIEFSVAGEIWLERPLQIKSPYVIVAGETAPPPGISLLADKLRIASHDVVLRHLRIRVGDLDGSRPENRDGISIDGNRDGRRIVHSVTIENCSIAWAIDEGLAVWGEGSRDITLRNNIIGETLRRSRHPKGAHSMGLVIGPAIKNIVIEGNLFVHNQFRNPAIAGGSSALVMNNLIYNPGNAGLHFYPRPGKGPTVVAAVANLLIAGPDTKAQLGAFRQGINPRSRIYYKDNVSVGTRAFNVDEAVGKSAGQVSPIVTDPPLMSSIRRPLPVGAVYNEVLNNAGARPWNRDRLDTRLVTEVRARSGQIRDRPGDERLQGPRSRFQRKSQKPAQSKIQRVQFP